MFGSKMLQNPIIEVSVKSIQAAEELFRMVLEGLDPESDIAKAINFYMTMAVYQVQLNSDTEKAVKIADVLIEDIKQNSVFLNHEDKEAVNELITEPLVRLVEASLVNAITFEQYVEEEYDAKQTWKSDV